MRKHWRTIPGFTEVGRLGKTFGRQGEMKAFFSEQFRESTAIVEFLFVDLEGSVVPYRLASRRVVNDLDILKFSEVSEPSEIKSLTNSNLYVPSDEFSGIASPETKTTVHALLGFVIIDGDGSKIGQITRVDIYPEQEIAVVLKEDREVLIPLHSEFISLVDDKAREIYMVLPDGLADLNS